MSWQKFRRLLKKPPKKTPPICTPAASPESFLQRSKSKRLHGNMFLPVFPCLWVVGSVFIVDREWHSHFITCSPQAERLVPSLSRMPAAMDLLPSAENVLVHLLMSVHCLWLIIGESYADVLHKVTVAFNMRGQDLIRSCGRYSLKAMLL